MRISSGGYGAASERQFSKESLERLANHELFDFQIQDDGVSVRVAELQELLQRGRDEPDLADLLDEFVHELEDLIFDSGENVTFLLASLQHFRQQMEIFLELDQEARMAASGMTKNIFATAKSGADKSGNAARKPPTAASPVRKSSPAASASQSHTRSPARKNQQQGAHPKPQQAKPHSPAKPQRQAANDDDVVCGVCLQADSLEHDPIVICDMCSVAVHQSCYRIEDLPDDDWFCRPCQRYLHAKDVGSNVTPTFELQCAACKDKGGAFIATVDDQWVHMACSMFLPELYVQASHKHQGEEVIGGNEQLGERRKLRCCYCKKKNRGACAQCVVGKCTTSYHVLCALKNGIKFVFMEDKSHFGSGCARHQKQFCGEENPHSATDEEVVRPKMLRPRETSTPASPHVRTASKGKKKLPRRRHSETSDSSEGDDGIELDEESDRSSMFSSELDSDTNSPPRRKSPSRPKAAAQPSTTASPRSLRSSPAKSKSPGRVGRPPKKQQTLMVPGFGIVKNLTKPTMPSLVATIPAQAKVVAPSSSLLPVPSPQQIPMRPPASTPSARMHTKTQLFVPVSGAVVESGTFEDVLLIIPTMPLGISIRTESRPHGKVMLIQGQLVQHNLIVIDALRRGILHDGDEMMAVNDVSLRNREANTLKGVLSSLQPPFRIWLKLKSKRSLASFGMVAPTTGVPAFSPTNIPFKPITPAKPASSDPVESKSQPEKPAASRNEPEVDETKRAAITEKHSDRSPMEEALSTDWPWFYLRSDGKIAMNLMWKSLDAGFFVQKFDPKTWDSLVGKVESLLGFRLSKTHPEYAQTTEEVLHFPSREFPVPKFIRDYRESQQQKKRYLASDSVFMDANLEQVGQDDAWDDLPPLAVGATVQVAKRTWPGINRLGGAGRVRKVHEETSEDGQKKRYLYDIAYILGGSEKKVERKWIQAVVDLQNENQPTPTKQPQEIPAQKTDSQEDAEAGNESVRLRLGLRLEVRDKDSILPVMPRSTTRKVHLQVSVLQNSVVLQKDLDADGKTNGTTKREMLWHAHVPVSQSGDGALLSDALSGTLDYVQDGKEDGDESDDDDNESEVTKQLLEAQAQFKYVMERNDALFSALKIAVETEYASKQYRKRKLDEIQSKHYNQMYRDLVAARKEFDESEEDSDDEDARRPSGPSRDQSKPTGYTRASNDSSDSESDHDESCGGMFINKIKQEGNEVCVLCELTGGDFAATSCGRVVHPQCAMYTPETFFKDGVAHGLDKIPADERRALTCSICSGKKGLSKIQCFNQRCLTAYHVSCAYVNGLLTRDPYYQAWCPKHLKTSGMQNAIEWPPHMKPHRSETKSKTPAKSPTRGSKAGGAISSSKSKRKRRRSGTVDATEDTTERKKPTIVIDVDQNEDEDALADRNCARRLDIDDDSDDGPDVALIFKKGDIVEVQARDWPGMNKPGGVARVTHVNDSADSSGSVTYDVAYVLDNAKEKQVEAKYVRVYAPQQAKNAANSDARQQTKKRSRATAV